VRAKVDEQQHFRAGLGVLLPGKNNPAIVADRTRVESFELTAEVMRFQPGIADLRRHAPQGGFNLRPERGIFSHQTTERPLKPGRENKLVHGSLEVAQPGDDSIR